MKHSRLGTIITCTLLFGGNCVNGDQKTSVKASVDRIHKVASSKKYYNLTGAEKALIKEIAVFGSDALPYLAKLISHPKREVTVVAAEAFEEISGNLESIDAKFLPAILHGLNNDHSGLPNALAKVKTPEGRAKYLSQYLKDSSSPQNQYQNGFRWHGADFLPHIIEVVRSEIGTTPQNVYLLGAALGAFQEKDRKTAAFKLLKAFDKDNTTLRTKRAILTMIGNLGPSALGVEDRLIVIWETQQDFKDETASTLIGIRSKKAGIILAEQLRRSPSHLLLRDISEVGLAAEGAGAQVATLLDHSDWRLRLGAARTIGFIGFHGADAKLVKLLDEPTDVRLNFVAAESLGRLQSKVALRALKRMAKDHWHPVVRDAAAKAADKIESHSIYKLKYPRGNFPLEYFEFEHWGIELPEGLSLPTVDDTVSLAVHAKRDPELPSRLSYPTEIVSYRASDEKDQKSEKGEDGIIIVNEENIVEHRRKVPQTPAVGLRVSDGWLLGADRGEWGGELVFKGDNKQLYKILEENIDNLFLLGERFIAVTGLAHLGLNNGMIYEVTLIDGKWQAKRWRALPGAPQNSGKLKNGEVMVATYGGGIIILSENGDLRMADISPKAKKASK